jgi:hypothetical protein
MTRRAKLLSVTLIAAVATALSGCADNGADTPNFTSGMGTPNPSASASASASSSPSPGASPSTATSKPPSYPTNAKDYAIATATAWASGGGRSNPERFAQLATEGAMLQVETWKGIDGHWGYISCDGTAGSSHCLFRNYNGDELTITIVNQYLGQPHAATEMLIDKTLYSTDATAYARNFMLAWVNGNTPRMLALSSQSVVDKTKTLTAISSSTTIASGAAGSTYVKFEGLGPDLGRGLTIRVENLSLGKRSAIKCITDGDTGC